MYMYNTDIYRYMHIYSNRRVAGWHQRQARRYGKRAGMCIYVNINKYMYVYIYIYIYLYIYIYICIYINIYINIYIYIYTDIHKYIHIYRNRRATG